MSLTPDTTMRGSRRCLTKYAHEQEENDDLNVGAAQEAQYNAANPILEHIISYVGQCREENHSHI